MKFKFKEKRDYTPEESKQFIYLILFAIGCIIFSITGLINSGINDLTSRYSIVINELDIPRSGVVIAPIVEELLKFIGYAVIFLFPTKFSLKLGYKQKSVFVKDYLPIAFLLSVGTFGVLEGTAKNIYFSPFCIISFVILQTLMHITYSVYPFILGLKYKNWFVCFLPIAILLHSVHNFLIFIIWNNKWISFFMVTIFLLPFVILERKKLLNLVKIKNEKRKKLYLTLVFIIVYVYIILCCYLAF